jgi:hypothetical protein
MSIFPINESPFKVEGTATSVFYLPPSGKPDPNAPWIPGEERPRIPQASQKGPTCWYYGGPQLLRLKIGNNAPLSENFIKARHFEKACSALRKGYTHLDHVHNLVQRVVSSNLNLKQLEQITLNAISNAKKIKLPLKEIKRLERTHHSVVDAMGVVKKFQEQTAITTLQAFSQENDLRARMQQDLQFLHEVGVDPSVMCINFKKSKDLDVIFHKEGNPISLLDLSYFENLLTERCKDLDAECKSLPSFAKQLMLEKFREAVMLQRLGFYPSCWQPHHTIDQLIKTLNTEGPLHVSGHFGASFYTQKATQKTTKFGHSVHGWEATDRKPKEVSTTKDNLHAVLIIGAEKLKKVAGKGMVYYIDPNVGSDPKNPKAQNFFRISYQEFITHIYCTTLIPTTLQTGFELSNSVREGYAFYCKPEEAIFPNQEKPDFEPVRVCVDLTMDPKSQLGICFAPSCDVPIACLPSESNENRWEGHILRGVEFLFVKIHPDHTLVGEKSTYNRILAPHWPAGKPLMLNNVNF